MVTANNYKAQNPKNRYAKSCKRTLLAIDICFAQTKVLITKDLVIIFHMFMLRGKRKFVLVNLMSNGIHKEPKNKRKNKELVGVSRSIKKIYHP